MKVFNGVLALSAVAFRAASAWQITFFSDDNCGEAADFTSTNYHGTPFGGVDQMTECLHPGEPGYGPWNCEWRVTSPGTVEYSPCTKANNPMPRSFWLQHYSKCFVTWSDGCGDSTTFGLSHVNKCLSVDEIKYWGNEDSTTLSFWCEAEDWA